MTDPLVAALTLLVAALSVLAITLSGTLVAAEVWSVRRRRPRAEAGATPTSPAEVGYTDAAARSRSLSGTSPARR